MRIRDWDSNLKVRLFGEFFVGVVFWMYFPFLTSYFTDSFGKNAAGLMLTASTAMMVVASFFGGYCADRFGRKRMMVISTALQCGMLLLLAMSAAPWWKDLPLLAYFCFMLDGIFSSFYNPASQAMIADVVDEKDRPTVFSAFYTLNNLAVVFGPAVGSFFFKNYRFELYLTTALVMFTLLIVLQKLLRETAPRLKDAVADKDPDRKWYDFLIVQLKSYKLIFTDKIFFLFIAAGVLLSQTYMQLDLLIPVYVKSIIKGKIHVSLLFKELSLTAENIFGSIVSMNGLVVILFTMLVTKWCSRYRERNVFAASSLLYAISMIYVAIAGHWVHLYVAMVIFTFAEIMTAGIQQNFISRIAPEHLRGQYFAASSLRWTIGRTLAPLTIMLSGLIGFRWTFIVVAVLAVISAYMYYSVFNMADKKYPPQKQVA